MAKPNKDSVQNYISFIKERIEAVDKDSEISEKFLDGNISELYNSIQYLVSSVQTLTSVARLQIQLIDYLADYIE